MLSGMKKVGGYVKHAGLILTCLMAGIGTISLDIVLLAFIIKKSREDKNNFDGFITGWLLGSFFSSRANDRPLSFNDYRYLLLASPFLTAIAVCLSVLLGVFQPVGAFLLMGWGVSLFTIGMGAGIESLADTLGSTPAPVHNNPPPAPPSGYGSSYNNMSSNFGSRPSYTGTYTYVYVDGCNHQPYRSSTSFWGRGTWGQNTARTHFHPSEPFSHDVHVRPEYFPSYNPNYPF